MVRRKGFTLAELLIVIVILGILGSIAMPRFFPQKEKAIVAEAVTMLGAIRQGELAYRLENGGYLPIDEGSVGSTDDAWNQLGIDDPDSNRFLYSVVNNTNAEYAQAKRQGAPDASNNGRTIELYLANGTWTGDHPHVPSNLG